MKKKLPAASSQPPAKLRPVTQEEFRIAAAKVYRERGHLVLSYANRVQPGCVVPNFGQCLAPEFLVITGLTDETDWKEQCELLRKFLSHTWVGDTPIDPLLGPARSPMFYRALYERHTR